MRQIVTRIIIAVIMLSISDIGYAAYDGRLADDPYRKSPVWIYVLIAIGILYVMIKVIYNLIKKHNFPYLKDDKSLNKEIKSYQASGRYWDVCPYCHGTGFTKGKEISYLAFPPEKVCCDQCKGYGHRLTPEAERLHDDYCKQYDEEQREARILRDKVEKEREEERKKLSEENWNKKRQVISDIKSAGRSVLKEHEYLSQLDELRAQRKELIRKIMSDIEKEPLCTSCSNGNIQKDCPVCRGTGHIPTIEANNLIDKVLELSSTIKQLWGEYRVLYQQNENVSRHIISLEGLTSLLSDREQINLPKSTLIRDKIIEMLKGEPYCEHCKATGYLGVTVNEVTKKAYERVICCNCNGRGKLYYN